MTRLGVNPAPKRRALVVHALKETVRIQLEPVISLRTHIHTQNELELQKLRAWARRDRDVDGIDDVAPDIVYELEEALALGEQLLLVALYRIVELTTVRVLGWRFGPDVVAKNQLYKANKLSAALKHQAIDVRGFPGFAQVDELRCLNNAIKHDGSVTADLAKYSGWVLGKPLGDCNAAIGRLSGSVGQYLDALVDAVVPS
jgi:hypothetical protein